MTLTIASIVLSVVGTVVTLWQAWSARNASHAAKRYRDELLEDRRKAVIAGIIPLAYSAREASALLQRPIGGRVIRGISEQTSLDNIDKFANALHDHVDSLGITELKKHLKRLEDNLLRYRKPMPKSDRYQIADEVLFSIRECTSLITRKLHYGAQL